MAILGTSIPVDRNRLQRSVGRHSRRLPPVGWHSRAHPLRRPPAAGPHRRPDLRCRPARWTTRSATRILGPSPIPRAARRPQPPAAGGRRARGVAAAHRRRCRLGQDPRADPPDRLPARRRGTCGPARSWRSRSPTRPPARCASGSTSLVGAAGAGHVGVDLPLRLRPDPAARGRSARPAVHFSIYDAADSQRLMTLVCRDLDLDPKRYPPRVVLAQVCNLKNELVDHETFAARADEPHRADARRGVRGLPAAAAPGERAGLRRPDHDHGQRCCRPSRTSPSTTAGGSGTSWSTSTRTPTTRSTCWSGAGGRSAARVARLPRRPSSCVVGDADQSIYAFRGATIRNILEFEQDYPERHDDPARAELPLDADDPVRRQRRDRREPEPQAEERCGPTPAPGEQIVGYVADNEHDEAAFVAEEIDGSSDDGEAQARRGGGVLPHQRAVPGVRGGVHPGRPAVQGGRRRPLLRAPRDPRRAGLPAGAGQPRRHRHPAPHPQHARARHRRPCRGVRSRRSPSASGSRSPQALGARPRTRPASRPGRCMRCRRSPPWWRGCATLVEAGDRCRPTVLEAVLEQTGLPRRAARITTRRTRPGREPRRARWRSRASSTDAEPGRRTLADFLEQVALVADADEIPRGRRTDGRASSR